MLHSIIFDLDLRYFMGGRGTKGAVHAHFEGFSNLVSFDDVFQSPHPSCPDQHLLSILSSKEETTQQEKNNKLRTSLPAINILDSRTTVPGLC